MTRVDDGEGACYRGRMPRETGARRLYRFLDTETRAKLPPLYSNEALGLEALAVVKVFVPTGPDSFWSWFASEGSPVDEDGYLDTEKPKVDVLFFGLVCDLEIELGFFSLSELEDARGGHGEPVQRDRHYHPTTLCELIVKCSQG